MPIAGSIQVHVQAPTFHTVSSVAGSGRSSLTNTAQNHKAKSVTDEVLDAAEAEQRQTTVVAVAGDRLRTAMKDRGNRSSTNYGSGTDA